MNDLTLGAVIVAVLSAAGALAVGWTLFRLDVWATRRGKLVDDWMALYDAVSDDEAAARERHPAARVSVVVPAGVYLCNGCGHAIVGPEAEHLCPGWAA